MFFPDAPRYDDCRYIRSNGMWYQSWQSGYFDILKRGFPKPADSRTVLAELRSPQTPDFLHGGSGDVPFLVSERARDALCGTELSGFTFDTVVVAKIATLGKRKERPRATEPEDAILRRRGVDLSLAPTLFAVRVIGRRRAIPDFSTGRHPSGSVSPFDLAKDEGTPDVFRPELDGQPFSAWCFCSARFKEFCETHELTNIAFRTFNDFMRDFRISIEPRCSTPNDRNAS
jgi:hypothetical protein